MSFPMYPEYKDSGVPWLGAVPKHWGVQRLKTLFTLMKRPPLEDDGIVTAFRDGEVTLRSNRRVEGFTNALQEVGYQGVRKGDLVIHAMDAFAGAIGVSDSDGKSTPVYSVCTPACPAVDSQYYGLTLRHMALSGFVNSLAKGIRERSTEFRWADASVVDLPVPPIGEQTAITCFLNRETAKIDALVAEQEQLITLLKEKRQAIISHAVTKGLDPSVPMKDSGIEWLGEVPTHWDVIPAKRVASIFVPQRNKPELNTDGDGFYWVTMEQMRTDVITTSDFFVSESAAIDAGIRVLPAGAVVASCVGTFGLAAINVVDVVINQQLQAFEPTADIVPSFLRYCVLLAEGYFNQIGTAATITYVNQLGFANMPLALPPKDEQYEIVKALTLELSNLDALTIEATSAITLLNERRSALISAAVTGQIDVRGLT